MSDLLKPSVKLLVETSSITKKLKKLESWTYGSSAVAVQTAFMFLRQTVHLGQNIFGPKVFERSFYGILDVFKEFPED